MIIDATDAILGRLAAYAAKKALLGEKVDIINCEKAIVSGSRNIIIEKYQRKLKLGAPLTGPYYPRTPDRLVRRTIRGMLPYRRPRGKEVFKKVMCYIGIPEQFKAQKIEKIEGISKSRLAGINYMAVGEISKIIGSKV